MINSSTVMALTLETEERQHVADLNACREALPNLVRYIAQNGGAACAFLLSM